MKNNFFLILAIILSLAFIKEPNYWETLSKVVHNHTFDAHGVVTEFNYKFHPKIQKLEGKKIQLKGFVWREKGKPLTLCKFSYPAHSHCSLYGNPGPEIYVELKLNQPRIYTFNEAYLVEGIFHLEEKDTNNIFYKLEVHSMRSIIQRD